MNPAAETTPNARPWRLWLGKIARGSNVTVAVVAVMGVLGWLAGRPVVAIFGLAFPIIHPLNTVVLILTSVVLYLLSHVEARPQARRVIRWCTGVIGLLAFYSLALRIGNFPTDLDVIMKGEAYARRVPFASAALQLMLAASLSGAVSRRYEIRRLAHWLTVAMASIAAVTLINQTLLLVRLNPSLANTGISLPMALAVLAVSFSLIAHNPPSRLLQMLEQDSPGAIILRRLLPLAVALPVLVGWAQALAHRIGWVDLSAGEGGLVIFTIVSCTALLLWTSRRLDEMNTHRFQAEYRASTDRDWLEATLANINEVVVTTTHAGRIGFLNRAAEEMFGVKTEAVRGRVLGSLVKLVDEVSGETLSCPLGHGGAGRTSRAPALCMPNGMLKPVEISATSILDGDGRLSGGVLVLRDASVQRAHERALLRDKEELDRRVEERTRELRQAMTALRERTVLLQTFAATTPELIYAKDREGRLTLINPAAARAIGMQQQDALGKTARDIFGDSKYLREHLDHDQRVLDSGESLAAEEILVSGHQVRIFLVTKSPLRDEDGEITGLVGVAIDISERKRAERQLEQMLLSEYRMRERAETLNRSKDELLAVVSHELRSPLNALKGWSQIVADTPEPDPLLLMRATLAIKRNVEHQNRLINDLLDNSRILLGKMALDRKPVDLVEVVNAAIEIAQGAARDKRIELRFIDADSRAMINGDAGRLQQVVTNLLSNGIKFTPEGGYVEIRVQRQEGSIALSVADNGIGMEPEFLPHAFNRFSQARDEPTKRYRGLGIGLTLVKHLVEMHGGGIQVASPGAGQGTTVIVTLPAIAADGPLLSLVQGAGDATEAATGT